MTKLNYICVIILLLGALIFGGAFLYYQNNADTKLHYARTVTSITSTVVPDFGSPSSEHELVSGTLGITEERGILIAHIVAILMAGVVIYFMLMEKKAIGSKTMQVPLIAASIMLVLTIITSVSKQGLI